MKNSQRRLAIFIVLLFVGCRTSSVSQIASISPTTSDDKPRQLPSSAATSTKPAANHVAESPKATVQKRPVASENVTPTAQSVEPSDLNSATASGIQLASANHDASSTVVNADRNVPASESIVQAENDGAVSSTQSLQLVALPDDEIPAPATLNSASKSSNDQNSGTKPTEQVPSLPYEVQTPLTTGVNQQAVPEQTFPVNLPTVLRLVGSRNLSVQLATERIQEAEAKVAAAEAMWLPSLNFGLGSTKHDGQIQATNGDISDVSRNALFLGGGAKVGSAPLAGGAGGPSRFMVDLSLADALFKPLVARQLSCAAKHRRAVDLNNAELQATLAYYDLVTAQAEAAVIKDNLKDANALMETTRDFVDAGKAADDEVTRIRIVISNHKQALVDVKMRMQLASTELVRIIRLDPELTAGTLLFSAENQLIPIELIPANYELQSLIALGRQARPEMAELASIEQARLSDAHGTMLRPYIPNLYTGISTGVFGGGQGSDIRGLDGRADLDVQLVWEIRNLGYGEMADRAEKGSRHRQAVLQRARMQDVITAEVKRAWHRSQAARQKMQLAETNVTEADRALRSNMDRIEGLEGLPIEALQALNAIADARLDYLKAVVAFNKSQAELLRAIGQPVK